MSLDDYLFIETTEDKPKGSIWCVYQFRGGLVACFEHEREAIECIQSQKVPSEYYREAV